MAKYVSYSDIELCNGMLSMTSMRPAVRHIFVVRVVAQDAISDACAPSQSIGIRPNFLCSTLSRRRSIPTPRYPFVCAVVSLVCFLGLLHCIVPRSPSQCRPHHRKPSQRSRKSPRVPARRPRTTRESPTQHDSWVQVRAAANVE